MGEEILCDVGPRGCRAEFDKEFNFGGGACANVKPLGLLLSPREGGDVGTWR